MKMNAHIWIAVPAMVLMGACTGDQSSRHGQDTARQKYQTNPTIHSVKKTTTPDEGANLDHSGSGKTMTIRDTMKK